MFTYKIGEKTYVQKPLVLGQIRQLMTFLTSIKDDGVTIPERINALSVIESLGSKLCEAIAIVLAEEGRHLKDKDVEALAKEIEFSIDPETGFKVIEDFFDCNPIASTIERLTGAIERIVEKMSAGSKIFVPFSARETSPGETKSSGDIP